MRLPGFAAQNKFRYRVTRRIGRSTEKRHGRRVVTDNLKAVLVLLAVFTAGIGCTADVTSTLIANAVIVDGTGGTRYTGSVRMLGDRIVAIGDLKPKRGESIIDAGGLVLAPGFIDTHSHHDVDIDRFPAMPAVLSQGVTTIVRGNDGATSVEKEREYTTLKQFRAALAKRPVAVNVASYAPHGSIRYAVMGDDFRRPARPDEVAQMAALLEADLSAGAIGISTGLEYEPGLYSATDELIGLAKVAARYGGIYASHLRDEDDRFMEALKEAIVIGRDAGIPVHVSHIKLADRAFWGTTSTVLDLLDAARAEGLAVSADIYPYVRWQSSLAVLFPDRDFHSRATAEKTFAHAASAADIVLAEYPPNPAFNGMTIAEIANANGRDEVTTLLELAQAAERYLQETGMTGSNIIAKGMDEADIISFLEWPHTVICSDGSHRSGHPRGHGAFPRVLGRYVRELGVLTLEQAVHKMTMRSAEIIGLDERGRLEPGSYADLVLFDAEVIADHATMAEPTKMSTGVVKVWVNGELAFESGAPTAARAGRVLANAGR